MKHTISDREVQERIDFHRREEDRHHKARQDWEQEQRTRNISRSLEAKRASDPAKADAQMTQTDPKILLWRSL